MRADRSKCLETLLCGVGLAACGAHPQTIASRSEQRPVARRADPPATCPSLTHLELAPAGALYCTDEEGHGARRRVTSCYSFDADTRVFSPAPDRDAPVTAAVGLPATPLVHVRGAGVEACAPNQGRCTTITPRDTDVGATAVDANATRLLIMPRKGRVAELWDLDVIQRLATIRLRTAACARRAQFIEATLLLVEAESCERDARQIGSLLDERGQLIATVGGPGFDLSEVQPLPVTSTEWAFFSRDGRVVVQDVSAGSQTGPFDLGRAWREGGWLAPISGGRLLVIASDARVVVIDPATGAVDQFDPPSCPERQKP